MTTGIYSIINIINGWVYIGSSKNIESRFASHSRSLRHNVSKNKSFQADANRYGISAFIFKVIEVMPDTSTNEEISEREQYHTTQAHKFGKCYNPKLVVLRKGNRRCLICGNKWHYSKDMCQSHWQGWKQATKTFPDIQPSDYIKFKQAYGSRAKIDTFAQAREVLTPKKGKQS
jgi:group I intron endonuclease